MAICKHCGEQVETKFCGNCGAKVDDGQSQNINTGKIGGINFVGFDFASFTDILKKADDIQKNLSADGNFSMEKLNSAFSSAFGDISTIFQSSANTQMQDTEKQEQIKQARLAILNNMCPTCGEDFSQGEEICKKCGTNLDITYYTEN